MLFGGFNCFYWISQTEIIRYIDYANLFQSARSIDCTGFARKSQAVVFFLCWNLEDDYWRSVQPMYAKTPVVNCSGSNLIADY